ncbi:hypothetical protein ACW73L_09405 [Methylolobus aquaticus]
MSTRRKSRAGIVLLSRRAVLIVSLLAVSGILLYFYHRTQWDLLSNLAMIPLELIVGAILVEGYVARKEQEKRARQLMFIKSFIFRSELRNLYLANFAALEQPAISMSMIRRANLEQLRAMREAAATPRYRSPEEMETVIMEYVAAYPVFYGFMEWAIANDSDAILSEMVFVLHFIQDVKVFKRMSPGKLYMQQAQQHQQLMGKVMRLLGTGIVKFLDYAIELHVNQPTTFDDLLADYEAASRSPTLPPEQDTSSVAGHTLFQALMRNS